MMTDIPHIKDRRLKQGFQESINDQKRCSQAGMEFVTKLARVNIFGIG